MTLVNLIIVLVVLGVALYVINQIKMPDWIKNVINAIAALFVVLWVLNALGIISGYPMRLR